MDLNMDRTSDSDSMDYFLGFNTRWCLAQIMWKKIGSSNMMMGNMEASEFMGTPIYG